MMKMRHYSNKYSNIIANYRIIEPIVRTTPKIDEAMNSLTESQQTSSAGQNVVPKCVLNVDTTRV